MNDDLCDFRHKNLEYDYIRDEVKEVGKMYTAKEVDKRVFEVIIRLLEKNNWKLEVSTSYDGHYIGNGIHSLGPFTTKSTVKTINKIWKEKKKMNSVCDRIAKKQQILGGIGFTDLCSHVGVNFSTSPDVKYLEKDDPVNHPKHYTSDPSGVECIQITRHRNFNIGNAIKYLWRAGLKESNSDIQDLEKAIWYINDEIKRLKGEYNK